MSLEREDYVEPVCALCGKPGEENPFRPVPRDRILEKLRAYEDRNDWGAAERHLNYWLEEAKAGRDERGQLMLHNELMGFHRKQGNREPAFLHAEKAAALVEKLGMEDTVTAGTTWVNAGTVREAFGESEGGLAFFERARSNYEKNLPPEDSRLGGLYNNMGLTLASLGRWREAETAFRRAIEVMGRQEHGEPEQAITWLNLADAREAELGPEGAEAEVQGCLEEAERLLNAEDLPRDGYYAFVCEHCAPVYGHYGWFMTEAELQRRAEEIRRERGTL